MPRKKKNRERKTEKAKSIMLPDDVLLNILKCMSRDELEKMQETSRAINNIVKSEFISKPLRLLPKQYSLKIHIIGGSLLLHIQKSQKCFMPTSREWSRCNQIFCDIHHYDDDDDDWMNCGKCTCSHYYPLYKMRLFLPENLRIKNTTFWIERDEPYTSDQISAMESFAHIWTGQTLTIYDYEHSLKDSKKSLFLILSNSGILKCCTLKLYSCLMAFGWDFKTGALTPNKDLEVLLQYLCKLQTVIWRWPMGPKELIRIIQLKAAYPQSDTVFVVELQPCQFIHAIENIREAALESKNFCRLRIIINMSENYCEYDNHHDDLLERNLEFCAENRRTGEVVELKFITSAEAKEHIGEEIGQDLPLILSFEIPNCSSNEELESCH